MGDVQSSQGASEEEQQEPATTKPWSPDDISDTSDEDNTNTTKGKPVVTEPKPPDPPPSARKSNRRGKSRSSKSSASQEGSRDDEVEIDVPIIKSPSPLSNETSPPRSTQKSKTRNGRRRSERKNKFEVAESEALYPHINTEGTEVTIATQAQELQGPEVETQLVPDEIETPSKALQVRLKSQPTRFPCPQADAFKCDKTFATEASAKRHSQIHTHKYGHKCTVCSNTYTRADKLRTHRLIHTEEELREADQQARIQQDTGTDGDKAQADATPASPESVTPQPDLTTPNETSGVSSEALQHASTDTLAAMNIVDQSSTKTSTSATSVFDEPDELDDTEVVEETPRPKSRLKRKRPTPKVQSNNSSTADASRKRRRRNSLSPPTSVASDAEGETAKENEANDKSDALMFDLPRIPKPKLTKSGNLDNFAKPWIPGSKLHHPIHNPHSLRFGSSQQIRVIIPRSSNGGPSANPSEKGLKQLEKLVSDELDIEITPLAKKGKNLVYTSPKGKRKAEKGVRYSSPPQTQIDDDESDFEPDGMATSVARKGNSSQKPLKRKSSTTVSKTAKAPRLRAKSDEDDGEEGRKGQFSDAEINKLDRWRDEFCDDEGINVATFNQMMTDSCRRGKDFHWPYRIKRTDFMKLYVDVLPNRDSRSMRRFRERHYQNVPKKQIWTAEDDEELIELVTELGQKWVEIGQRMTRTQDSVSQRWRFKVQYGDKLHEGEWLTSEEEKLKEAFAQVKEELRLPLDPLNTDLPFTWASVSTRLKGKRTGRQCANKWRLMYQKRVGNKFVKSETDGSVGTSSKMATPSKMSQRLAGQTPSKSQPSSKKKKKIVSKERVYDSEDNQENDDDQELEEVESANSEIESSEIGKKKPTRKPRRNPLASQTPQTSSSLSQAFAQTQANTSALRAPTTSRKEHTQTEMPTPGIPVQHRPASSPLQSIKSGNLDSSAQSPQPAKAKPQKEQDDTDAIMASPESTDDDDDDDDESTQSQDTSPEELIDDEASEASTSESASNEDSSEETTSEASSSGDEMVQSTQKDSFVASLRSPSNRSSFSSRADRPRASQPKVDWKSVIRGEPEAQETETDSDEGDINHHD